MQSKSKEAKGCLVSEKSCTGLNWLSAALLNTIVFLKGKKGMIKLQAVYWMENVVFFTCNEKEIREIVVKMLEARVKCLDQHCGIYLSTLALSMIQ
jgi:hypothetical protein